MFKKETQMLNSSIEHKENDFEEYYNQMEKELADLVVEKSQNGQSSDVRTAFNESLKISRAFDGVLRDTDGDINIDDLQKEINPIITMLGLSPEKFSLKKLKDFIDLSEK